MTVPPLRLCLTRPLEATHACVQNSPLNRREWPKLLRRAPSGLLHEPRCPRRAAEQTRSAPGRTGIRPAHVHLHGAEHRSHRRRMSLPAGRRHPPISRPIPLSPAAPIRPYISYSSEFFPDLLERLPAALFLSAPHFLFRKGRPDLSPLEPPISNGRVKVAEDLPRFVAEFHKFRKIVQARPKNGVNNNSSHRSTSSRFRTADTHPPPPYYMIEACALLVNAAHLSAPFPCTAIYG
jgi:hypothetical protein